MNTRKPIFPWVVFGYNILVILWGAFVRATGSGAGCGAHWPTCNGTIIPRPEAVETVIEFVHRLTSGAALVLVVALVIWTRRRYARGSLIRWGAGLSLTFTVTEALLGAGLVLFGLVADNDSAARAAVMAGHLVNTFMLLAFLGLTGWWVMFGEPRRLRWRGWRSLSVLLGALGMVFLGASGAITALGDTLFPSSSLVEGFRADLSETAHFLIRLRVIHPVLAVVVSGFILLVALAQFRGERHGPTSKLVLAVRGLVIAQLFLGGLNVILLAPVWMQIVHLLVADLIWAGVVILFGITLGEAAERASDNAVHDPVK